MEGLPRSKCYTDPEIVREQVEDGYQEFGHLLDNINEPAILVDAQCKDFPIVGASRGFVLMSGWNLEEVKGKNCRMMFDGVPNAAISRSSRKNIASFCQMCQLKGVDTMSDASALQPNARRDGSIFMNLFLLGMCKAAGRRFILGVQRKVSDGPIAAISRSQIVDETESLRNVLGRIRDRVCASKLSLSQMNSIEWRSPSKSTASSGACEEADEDVPDFAFYSGRLQDHCMLLNSKYTAVRREPQELAFGCLAFGDRPVAKSRRGITFEVRVDRVTETFAGLPVLGFTKRQPKNSQDLFPSVARCLGSSVLIGADGEAFARDKHEHFKIGFKPPPQEEVQRWSAPAEPSEFSRQLTKTNSERLNLKPPTTNPPETGTSGSSPRLSRDSRWRCELSAGDRLRCTYTLEGWIELEQNDNVILQFDTGRPVDKSSDYYPVVDVCLSAVSLSIMPSRGEDRPEVMPSEACGTWKISEAQSSSQVHSAEVLAPPMSGESRERPDVGSPQPGGQSWPAPAETLLPPSSSSSSDKLSGLQAWSAAGSALPLLAAPKLDYVLGSLACSGPREGGGAATLGVVGLLIVGAMMLFPGRSQRL